MPSNNTPSQHHYNKSLHRREYDVFSPDGLICYTVPAGRIAHYGDEGKRMMVCRNYSSGGTCPMGSHCKFVHIDVPLSSLRNEAIHTHFVWREPSLVTYERLAPAMAKGHTDITEDKAAEAQLTIFGPNNRAPAEQVRAGDLLLTVGAERAFAIAMGEREVDTTKASPHPCHCAHYYFNQVCNRGAGCGFVHVISLNPKQAEARVRHNNFHKRLEAMGCHHVPLKEDEGDVEGAKPEKDGAEETKLRNNAKGPANFKPIRIPKGATIRPASPVAPAATATGSRRHSRTVSVSLDRKSAGASFDDVTAVNGLQDQNDPLLHVSPSALPAVHVGVLPAPQQGLLSVVVGVRAPTPSGFSRTSSQTNTAGNVITVSPSNGSVMPQSHSAGGGSHERRPSEHEILMQSQLSHNGQFPIRIPLPAQNGLQVPYSHQGNVPFNNSHNNATQDPLSFTSPINNYSIPTDESRYLSASANISRRPSNVADGAVHLNTWNHAHGSYDADENGLGGVDPHANVSNNYLDEGSFKNGGQQHRFNSYTAATSNYNGQSNAPFQSMPVASTTASTNTSFAFTANGQPLPFVTPASTNSNTAPVYALSIGDVRQESIAKPNYANGFDANLLQQRDEAFGEEDDSISRPSTNGFPHQLHLMHLQQDSRSGSTPATGSHAPTPNLVRDHFPNPHNNYTTEAARFTNLRHSRNATNTSEGGNSNAYNFSNSNTNYNGSNAVLGQQRSHARQGSVGADLNTAYGAEFAATPNKITTSPGRYAHNPYGGGNGSLGGSMLGSSQMKDKELGVLGEGGMSIPL